MRLEHCRECDHDTDYHGEKGSHFAGCRENGCGCIGFAAPLSGEAPGATAERECGCRATFYRDLWTLTVFCAGKNGHDGPHTLTWPDGWSAAPSPVSAPAAQETMPETLVSDESLDRYCKRAVWNGWPIEAHRIALDLRDARSALRAERERGDKLDEIALQLADTALEESELSRLRSENEALRRDAERWHAVKAGVLTPDGYTVEAYADSFRRGGRADGR